MLRTPLEIVTPANTRMKEDEIVSRVEAAFPAAIVATLQMTLRSDGSTSLDVEPRENSTRLPFDRVYVNPYTGQLLGERTMHRISFDSVDEFIHGLHIQLVGGP